MFDGVEYSSASECFVDELSSKSKRKKKKNNKTRRFSDEQIRYLEVSFETDTKLEPRKKAELAKELGLQPRQVAIWFQNKRARWKSKLIEKDYTLLLANYNNLASQFESLNKENKSLLLQLQKLKNEINHFEIQETAGNIMSSSCDGESDYTNNNNNIPSKPLMDMLSDDDTSIKAELMGQLDDENDQLLTSSQDWGTLDSNNGLIDQPTDETYQWWDFWC